MRAITVDTKGFSFSFKIIFIFMAIVSISFLWSPIQNIFKETKEASANVLSSTLNKNKIQENVIKEDGKYINIDFINGVVSLYNNGEVFESFKILHTPSLSSPDFVKGGSYSVSEKNKSKLSMITMVHLPFFVKFGDKYAIHGEPEFVKQKGEDVKVQQDGFIELSNWGAEKVYDFAEDGMSVYVKVGNEHKQVKKEVVSETEKDMTYNTLPATSAEAYVLADVDTGQIYLVKNGDNKYPIASITKLITASVATDVIGLDKNVMAPNAEYYKLGDLFYPLLLRSDNAVAKRIATHAGYSYFISNMNTYVKSVGMMQTSFADASGLSPRNISTAFDLTKLASHLHNKKSFILDITNESDMTITSVDGQKWNMKNQNRLAGDPHFKGGKLGYTDEAEQTSVSIFSVPLKDETHLVSVVILRSKDWKQDTRTLLRWFVENTE